MIEKLNHQQIVNRQKKKMNEPRLPFAVVLNNIRSLYNVGSMFRTADGAGIEKMWLCGITGCPPSSMISKTALGAEARLPWEYQESARQTILLLKEQGYQIVLLEQTRQSIPYQFFQPRGPVCLIVGNEIAGIDEELLILCDAAVEIEMSGVKNSLNVAVAFGIAVYHFRNALAAPRKQSQKN